MAGTRKTIDRETVVNLANRRIARLAESGTKEDADKRVEVIAFVSQALLDGDSYRGFRYLNSPTVSVGPDGKEQLVYDESRVHFN